MAENEAIFQISINNETYDLGAPADKIQITWGEEPNQQKCTLQDFFDNWQQFKENNAFVYYGEEDPTLQESIKIWWDTDPNREIQP